MASLKQTLLESFKNFTKILGNFGYSKIQDKYKLIILSYLYYITYETNYPFKLVLNENDKDNRNFVLDETKIRRIMTVYDHLMRCLPNNSCCVIRNNKSQFENPLTPRISMELERIIQVIGIMDRSLFTNPELQEGEIGVLGTTIEAVDPDTGEVTDDTVVITKRSSNKFEG